MVRVRHGVTEAEEAEASLAEEEVLMMVHPGEAKEEEQAHPL